MTSHVIDIDECGAPVQRTDGFDGKVVRLTAVIGDLVRAIINAPRPQRFVALSDIGQIPRPFASRASSPRHHRLSSATSARACSTIWSLSGLDKVELPYLNLLRC